RWYGALAREVTVVRYDGRGTGMSDRDCGEISLGTPILDLEAVVEAFGAAPLSLLSVFHTTIAAINYAVRHPERLSHLLLWSTFANGADYFKPPEVRAIRNLLEADWQIYTETGAHSFVGWATGDGAHQMALLMRESTELEACRSFLKSTQTADCEDLLS